MPFPVSPRVSYSKNPLAEVICQLRFPTILKIDAEPPVALQDALRGEYPELKRRRVGQVELPPELARALALDSGPMREEYTFTSADGSWKVGLANDFVALSTIRYSRWEDFATRLSQVLRSFTSEYKVNYFTRVGLRYIDVIRRSDLGLDVACSWAELLAPHVVGELRSAEIEGSIEHAVREIVVKLKAVEGRVRVRHGLDRPAGVSEATYRIDADFFSADRTEVANAPQLLEGFNRKAGQLFRWFITSKLHEAMGPTPISA